MNAIAYRKDVDGLRAVSILGVLFYHAFPSFLTGGFVGVDVFFVISGYLITLIINKNVVSNTFSILEFYKRRVLRILPALLVVLIFSSLAGWYILLSDEYKLFGKHLVAGTTFTSNILYLLEAGYFDKNSEVKPLLHLWSLGVEEQFYLIYPLLLMVFFKCKNSFLLFSILLSATLSCVLSYTNNAFAFYSPITRYWELCVGGLFAINTSLIIDNKIYKLKFYSCCIEDIISMFALLFIMISFVFFDKSTNFPGLYAFVPVIAAFILISTPNALVNRYILQKQIFVFIGLISYPLYMWHWPIFSFSRIVYSQELPFIYLLCAIFASFALAILSYLYIEKVFRNSIHAEAKSIFLLVILVIIGIVGLVIYLGKGFPSRYVNSLNVSFSSANAGGLMASRADDCIVVNENIKSQLAACHKDSRGNNRFILIGDSKAASLFPGLVRTSSENGRWIFVGGNGPNKHAVEPLISDSNVYKEYQEVSIAAINAAANDEDIDVVAIVSSIRVMFKLKSGFGYETLDKSVYYDDAFKALSMAVEILNKKNKKVIILIDNPSLANPEDCISRITPFKFINDFLIQNPRCSMSIDEFKMQTKTYTALLEEVKRRYPRTVEIFDTTPYLCDEILGVCSFKKNGRLMYSYSDHISDYASGLVGEALNNYLLHYSIGK